MPRMPVKPLLLTLAALLGMLALHAAATEAEALVVEARIGSAQTPDWTRTKQAAETRRAATPRAPVSPLVGRPDFGGAEAGFGASRSGHAHAGQDVFAPAGTPLVAVSDATVIEAGSDGGQGNYVHLFDRRRERTYVYMHMLEPSPLRAGRSVKAGERVGAVGCTGSCWGDHLHFEIREGRGWAGEPIDPLPHLRDWRPLRRPR